MNLGVIRTLRSQQDRQQKQILSTKTKIFDSHVVGLHVFLHCEALLDGEQVKYVALRVQLAQLNILRVLRRTMS